MSNDRLLIDYVPTVLKEVKPYKALMYGEQPEIINLFNGIDRVLNNLFVDTADIYGVERWEKILEIVPSPTYTLDERKFTILSRLIEELPFTYRILEHVLNGLCGVDEYEIIISHALYQLEVKVELTAINNFADVQKLLKRILPANLTGIVTIRYNQHYILKTRTHATLKARTHYQIRNTPF